MGLFEFFKKIAGSSHQMI